MNPRQTVAESEVIELAESIWSAGLIQSIAGFANCEDGAEIVAGGRRLRALQHLADQHPDLATTRPELANPMVMLAPDLETAEVWANTENVARNDLHPAQEIRAYGAMEAKGATVSKIARSFAVSEAHVYRRLALAHLPEPVIEALAAGEISLSAAACFTISDDERHSLDVLERVKQNDHWSAHQIKNALKPDSIKGTDRRAIFVGEEAYKAAGGKIGGDLFADETLFDSPDVLATLFAEKLEAEARRIREAEGWNWVEPVERDYVCSYSMGLEKYGRVYPENGELTEEEGERYDELAELAECDALDADGEAELSALQAIFDGEYTDAQKEFAGAYVYANRNGELQVSGGFIKPESKKAAIEAGVLHGSSHSKRDDAPKSPISAKLADDLLRVAKGARQHAVLRDPDLLIDLLAYQLSHDLRWANPIGLTTTEVPNWPSTEADGYTLDARLTTNPPRDMWDAKDLGASFRAFRKKGAEHVRGELARFLAALYRGGDEKLVAAVSKETKPNIREVWTPTAANFFKRVGGPYLNALWCDLLDLAEDHPTATTFAKLKKSEKAEKLEALFSDTEVRSALGVTEAQAARIDAWLPEGME